MEEFIWTILKYVAMGFSLHLLMAAGAAVGCALSGRPFMNGAVFVLKLWWTWKADWELLRRW